MILCGMLDLCRIILWIVRRSVPAARGDGSRDPCVAAADHRSATGQARSGAISGCRQNGAELGQTQSGHGGGSVIPSIVIV